MATPLEDLIRAIRESGNEPPPEAQIRSNAGFAQDPLVADKRRFAAPTEMGATANVYRTALEEPQRQFDTYAQKAADVMRRMGLEGMLGAATGKDDIVTPIDLIPSKMVGKAVGAAIPGILAGRKAVGAPIQAMQEAQEYLTSQGITPTRFGHLPREQARRIWDRYGISYGQEGLPRYEIPDEFGLTQLGRQYASIPLGPSAPSTLFGQGVNRSTRLDQVLDFPDLYRAYPQSRQTLTRIGYAPTFSGSYYHPSTSYPEGRIRMAANTPSEIESGLLHELTHGIQRREGHTTGTSIRTWKGIVDAPHAKLLPSDLQKLIAHLRNAGEFTETNWNDPEKRYLLDYLRKGGEVEARNVELRHAMPGIRIESPQITESVPRLLQLGD